MPELYARNIENEGVGRCVCDFVSGMTDRYAIKKYKQFYIPSNYLDEQKDNFLYKLAEQNNLQAR